MPFCKEPFYYPKTSVFPELEVSAVSGSPGQVSTMTHLDLPLGAIILISTAPYSPYTIRSTCAS